MESEGEKKMEVGLLGLDSEYPTVRYEDLPAILTIKELMLYLRVGRVNAYKLANTPGFPKKKFGNRFVFPKELVREWMENEVRKTMHDGARRVARVK